MRGWVRFLCIFSCVLLALPAASSQRSTASGLAALSQASSPDRPIAPWVFRSVLDEQPRMVTAALHPDLYIAFDATHGGLYKIWKEGVVFEGAVYDGKHGPQPSAQGYAYFTHRHSETPWVLAQGDQLLPVQLKFGGYHFSNNRLVLQYRLQSGDVQVDIEESPEVLTRGDAKNPQQLGLQRRFVVRNLPADMRLGLRTQLTALRAVSDVITSGTFVESGRQQVDHGKGKTLSLEGILWLNESEPTELNVYFHPGFDKLIAAARIKTQAPQDDVARGKQLIGGSDCQACHNEERKTIGPSYTDIANRYDNTSTQRARLAEKIISGGAGSWGEIPMNPHPDLMPADADLMLGYIFSFKEKIQEPTPDELFLGQPSRALPLDDKPKPAADNEKQLKPGLAVAAYHIEDFVAQTFSQTVYSGVASQVHVHDTEHLGPTTTNVRLVFDGFLQVDKAGTYQLRLITDDGGRLWLNDKPLIDRWQHQGPTPVDVSVDLQPGLHKLKIDFFQALGGGAISMQWLPPGEKSLRVIPEKNLRHHQHQLAQPVPYIPRRELVKSVPGDKLPLADVHPSFSVASARPSWFTPMVGGMDFFSDGRLALCTWDKEGGVYVLEGVLDRTPEAIKVSQIASGLGECLGLAVVDDQIYVLQKHELTHLLDHDKDGAIDEYRTLSDQWRVSANFHEFAFGLGYREGYFYAALATAIDPGGASTQPQIPDRGRAIKISRQDGHVEFIAHGLRTPNGIGQGVDGEFFITDNQGDWLPSSKLVHLKPGAFYGSRSVDFAGTKALKETPPVVWLPQDEIGNSPSEPIAIHLGDYAGQMLHGEVTHGGIKRVYVEKVNGEYQGAVFRFTQGLEAGVNRLAWSPDGEHLLVGGIGNPGNWGHQGKKWFGLERLTFNGQQTFEMLRVSARTNGMEIEFTQPLEAGRGISADEYQVMQWYYQPTEAYGGDKLDLRQLTITSVNLSKDRTKVFLELQGMKPGHLVYIRIADAFLSASGQSLWSTEAWYTLNQIPTKKPGFKSIAKPQLHNTLSAEQRRAGWQLLFDGKTTQGWRSYSAEAPVASGKVGSAWRVVDGMLHLDPQEQDGWQTKNGGDIITEGIYENYELYLEWKLAPGGNSGLIYGVVESPEYQYTWQTGTEYQLLDNPAHPDGAIKTHRAGDLYDLISSRFVAVNEGGEWNRTRLVVNKGKVEHWLNGYKVVEYDRRLPAWQRMIAESKFKDMPGFGKTLRGHIALQDHGDRVWFRNIRIREL